MPNRLEQKRKPSQHKMIRTLNVQRLFKDAKGRDQVKYKSRPIKITHDFSMKSLKARGAWTDIPETLRDHSLYLLWEFDSFIQWHFGWVDLECVFFWIRDGIKQKWVVLVLSWVARAKVRSCLRLVLFILGLNNWMKAAGSAETSTLYCIREFVYPLYP